MSDIKTVDARGLSCPQPALLTQQALCRLTGGTVQVLVDSGTARDNVARVAQRVGWKATIEDRPEGGFQIVLTK